MQSVVGTSTPPPPRPRPPRPSSPSATSSSLLSHRDISFPSGYLPGDHDTQPTPSTQTLQKTADLVYQSAMNTALAPGKQLLMTGFMLWMSGNTLQIFSIMMLGMALYQPLTRMFNVQARVCQVWWCEWFVVCRRLVFVLCNLAGVGLALYKCQSMGLLPTSSADWLSTRVRPRCRVLGWWSIVLLRRTVGVGAKSDSGSRLNGDTVR